MGDFDDDDDVLDEAGALIAQRGGDGLERLLGAHAGYVIYNGDTKVCHCGDVLGDGVNPLRAHVADVLRREGWHRSEVEYSVRYDRTGYVESRHTSRESAEWSLGKLREEGVPCSLVKRLRAGAWVVA